MKNEDSTEKPEKPRRNYRSYAWTDKKTGYLYARVRVKRPNGKTKSIYKRAKNLTHVAQLVDEIFDEHAARGEGFLEGRELVFNQAADWYRDKFVVAPVYNNRGQKVEGMRTWEFERGKIERLKKFFGPMKIVEINENTLEYFVEDFKQNQPEAKQTTVNRYLETLRAMFGKFKRKRWISESPFEFGEQLISKAMEDRRTVTLTEEQETAILECARRSKSARIFPLILLLRDSGARPSEVYPVNEKEDVKFKPVEWRDFSDFNYKAVRLTSFKGKQIKERFAPVTVRVKNALLELKENIPVAQRAENEKIFPHKSYKRSWGNVRVKALFYLRAARKLKVPVIQLFDGTIKLTDEEIKNLENEFAAEDLKLIKAKKPLEQLDIRLRDLRRDFRTRLARAGYSDQLAQRLMGHESAETTFHYTEADMQAVFLAGDVLNDQNGETAVIETDSLS
jgi:site-specific recombinase XerD